jgi:hypothetical protein
MDRWQVPLHDLIEEAGTIAPRSRILLAEHGIITLADHNYFPGLQLLHRSAQESYPVQVACFDLGLTDEQRRIAASTENLTILPIPRDPLIETVKEQFRDAPQLAKRHKRVWPLWVCPALIAAAPFHRVFWFDCDIAILRNLRELFALLDEGPVFTPENNAPEVTPNKAELYDMLPINREFDYRAPAVNAGVSGWDLARDRGVIAAYIHPVARAAADDAIRKAVSWHDQGALIWAIQRCSLEERVTSANIWNRCIKNSIVGKARPKWDSEFLQNLRTLETQANVLHWNGARLPWLD